MKVTEEEFLKALSIVKAYKDSKRILLEDFYNENKDIMSRRLRSCINGHINGYCRDGIKITYLNQINSSLFFRTRNVGKKTWIEFNDLIHKKNVR